LPQVLENYYGIKPKRRPDLDPGEEDLTETTEETEREDWNFPEDKEGWKEKDLGEEWADAPEDAAAPFYDPNLGLGVGGEDEYDDDDDTPRRSGHTASLSAAFFLQEYCWPKKTVLSGQRARVLLSLSLHLLLKSRLKGRARGGCSCAAIPPLVYSV